jgi:D-glycerate 3-kinase
MPAIIDDKSEHCIPFLLKRLKQHRQDCEAKGETPPPFFIGLNGVQGAGKTTLVCRSRVDSYDYILHRVALQT